MVLIYQRNIQGILQQHLGRRVSERLHSQSSITGSFPHGPRLSLELVELLYQSSEGLIPSLEGTSSDDVEARVTLITVNVEIISSKVRIEHMTSEALRLY